MPPSNPDPDSSAKNLRANPFRRPGPAAATAYPLLVQAGTRTLFYDGGGVVVLPAALGTSPDRRSLLEDNEARLAEGRLAALDELLWTPADVETLTFLRHVVQKARRQGGLRFHSYLGDDLPIEALAVGGGDLAREIPILRIAQTPAAGGDYLGRRRSDLYEPEAPGVPDPADRPGIGADRILIYDNPLGVKLPRAREEARRVLELCAGFETRFIARPLSEAEWGKEFAESRAVFYFGHGTSVSGLPAIPVSGDNQWTPFLPPGSGAGRFLVFDACLEEAGGGLRMPGNVSLVPVCRIADRSAPFVTDYIRAWLEQGDPCLAFAHAAERDADRGDFRRLVFRLQGGADAIY